MSKIVLSTSMIFFASAVTRQYIGEDMKKSLELNFWPILYDSIVFLCLQTPKVYLKLKII